MKKSLLICLLAITAITTRAQDNDLVIAEDATNQIAYATFKTDKNGNRISNSYSGDVVIPEKSPSGYPVTGINRVEADASAAEWYSLNGQRSSSARKGLNIMRTADGKTRKVIVR